MRPYRFFPSFFAAAVLTFPLALPAQIRIDSGAITGSVKNISGAALAGALVTVTDSGRGASSSRQTDAEGWFRFEALKPGSYSIRGEAAGYQSAEATGFTVLVGESVTLNLELTPEGGATFSATAAAAAPVLDFEKTSQSSVLNSQQIGNLPINRRNYLDFALLAPTVVETVTVANGADFRIPVLQESGLSFGGSNGRGNSLAIDGVQNVGVQGNVRPSVSQEAVQEFVVNRNGYSAELGGGYGGAVNIITKSGSNQLHGSLFGFLRNRRFEARNFFDPAKSSFTRTQSGASAGGAIRRDRLFVFAAFERLDRHESNFVPILQDRAQLDRLTPGQQRFVDTLAGIPQTQQLAGILGTILRPSSNPLVRPLYDRNSGVFPFSSEVNQASARLDYRPSDRHAMFVRWNGTTNNSENSRFGALVGYSRGVADVFRDSTLAVNDRFTISPSWLSVTRLSLAYTRFSGIPNDGISPELNVAGSGYFGRDSQFPYHRKEAHIQIQQSFAFQNSRHSIKFGADFQPVRTQLYSIPWNGGRFEFAAGIPLGALLPPNVQLPPALAPALGEPLTSLQSFAIGIPVAYFQAFGSPDFSNWQGRLSAFAEDNWRVGRGLFLNYGVRFQGESNVNIRYLRTFAPRLGFAWSPGNSDRWVVRGGFGLFHTFNDELIPYSTYGFKTSRINVVLIPLSGVPGVINPKTGQPVNSADIYSGLLAQGVIGRRPIEFADLAQFGIGAGFRTPTTGDLSPVFRSAYTRQASLEVERSAGLWTFSAAYNFSRASHLPRVRDYNLSIIGRRPDGWPVFGRANPALLNNFIIESTGNLFYHALVAQVTRRMARNWTLQGHYTFSRAIDDVTDYSFDFAAHNQFDNRSERGLSLFHQKHRVVLNSVYQFREHWTFSGILRGNSGRPFNVLTGFDNLGDSLQNTHRPLGLGRNAGNGPDFVSLDLRLGRQFPLGERVRAEATVEVFNAANRTNFVAVNNIVGATPVEALPRPLVGRRGSPTDPLAFASAADPRQFQLGLRLSF